MQAEAGIANNTASGTVPESAYINLLKASWIVIDVINVHPQLHLSEESVKLEVVKLSKVCRYLEPKG